MSLGPRFDPFDPIPSASGREVHSPIPTPRPHHGFAETQSLFRSRPGLPAELRALEGLVEPVFLRWAARRGEAVGLGADTVVLRSGVVDPDTMLQAVSKNLGVEPDLLEGPTSVSLDVPGILASGLLPAEARDGETQITIALAGNNLRTIHNHLSDAPELAQHFRITSFERLRDFLQRSCGERLAHDAAFGLRERWPVFSAGSAGFAGHAIAITLSLAVLFALPWLPSNLPLELAWLAVTLFFSAIFVAWAALRVTACFMRSPRNERLAIPDHALPIYSILIPLYREANVVAAIVRSISALDYPREKLDVKLILEADDAETIAAARAILLDPCFEIFIAPRNEPRTKPKALQAALPFVRGEYIVVYDAEDRPHPAQLRDAYGAFLLGKPQLACVQAKLAIDNRKLNFLTRHFRAEYCGLFDVLLPALTRWGLPLPLGGTSNHFRADLLRRAGGWDPHNVTEDADLGIRLARFGYQTGIIDSTTWEEAPEQFGSWLSQRTRWFKGWTQTYVVHMRDGKRLRADLGRRGYLAFQLLLGGTIAAALVHPVFLFWLINDLARGELSFSGPVAGFETSIILLTLCSGYLASISLAVTGLRKRRFSSALFILLTMPLYWLLLSAAAWRAVWQLVHSPYHWEKTEHGLAARGDNESR
ncbi:MAG TPA: glycosyltransferase [Xanthobacteraceae bacterium]|nr:glycosyltransferase [Xanthobacteraceae bacterium]